MHKQVDVVIPVFNAADVIGDTVDGIFRQDVPDGWTLNVVAVDDGSTDETARELRRLEQAHTNFCCVRLQSNGGRGGACNAGVAACKGTVIVICDADCRYTRPDAIAEFLREIEAGSDAVIGVIALDGAGFWARYTNSVIAERRIRQRQSGLAAWSTGNFAIRRATYESLRGYSADYSGYGFEDKDLLVRLQKSGANVAIRSDVAVSHDGHLDLATVCRKAEESARTTGRMFRDRHPEAYRQLAYARCDGEGALRVVGFLSPLLKTATRGTAQFLLSLPPFAFQLQKLAVRTAVCAAYFHGSRSGT